MNTYLKDLISIIIPSYDRYEMLLHSIQSVLDSEYKNVEISILKYLEKTNLPYSFHVFYPNLIQYFKKNYEFLVNKFINKTNKQINLTIYNNMSAFMDYKHLIQLMEISYNDFKKIDLK